MKTYTHDYTLAANAESKVHDAYMMCQEDAVKQLLEDAQELLRKYLAHDNLIEDNDIAEAAAKDEFDDDQIVLIRDAIGCMIEEHPKYDWNQDLVGIINVCQERQNCPTFISVEQFLNNKSGLWTEIEED